MRSIKAWFAIVDEADKEDKREAASRQVEKSQRRFGMSEGYTIDGGCTVIEPPASIWLNKKRLNRVHT